MEHAVIMAGGSGTRFWPWSRRRFPKQLLTLTGDRSLLQATAHRVRPWIPAARTWIATNETLASATSEQLPDLPREHILCEPCGRNTAPCIGLAAVHLLHSDPEAVMLVMPADHVIRPDSAFRAAARAAAELLHREPQKFVLFGIPPTQPATGYGYIERGGELTRLSVPAADDEDEELDTLKSVTAFDVVSFREKPERETAEEYLRRGTFFWNSGIFVWRADRILAALTEFEPEIGEHLRAISEAIGTAEYDGVLQDRFPRMKSISIDYAVLERATGVTVIEAPFEWDDVGSWEAVARLQGTDALGNTISGTCIGNNIANCIIQSQDNHLIAAADVSNLIIVHTPDATLIARRGDEDVVRDIVAGLEDHGFDEFL